MRWPPAAPVARPLVSPSVTFVGVLCGAWQVLQDLSDKQHPYIVSLHHSFQDDSHLYLVMDFVNGGQIFFHLRQARPSPRRRRPEAGGRPARAGAVEL